MSFRGDSIFFPLKILTSGYDAINFIERTGAKIYMASAIIVAAGKGMRMQDPVRKQYLRLGGRPIVSHTLMAVDGCDLIRSIILVIPPEDEDFCRQKIVSPLNLHKQIQLVAGGAQRQDSVFNGLSAINDKESPVAIHDGVRPFVTAEQISQCIQTAKETGACIMGIPVLDTVKRADGQQRVAETLDRSALWLSQTPQVFDFHIIHRAHIIARQEAYQGSDDSLLVERLGYKVKIIPGTQSNIKITTPEDLLIGEAILQPGGVPGRQIPAERGQAEPRHYCIELLVV